MPDVTLKQIKKAYYNCMKSCHPDLSGNDPDMTNFCMFINEVYYMDARTMLTCVLRSFKIEEDFGRARVYDQSGSTELIQKAIDSW
ncbi:hypothetical protein SORBI_3003G285400 [Sorghum bicolor]|uniref:J domain-containing protein n=1 Tax=Sorghum bicolor TaxID=4558 RepID=C5XJ22_SORBI|nr:hypothetical protein SORBI_3003G285400 [Sorghum bicolor]